MHPFKDAYCCPLPNPKKTSVIVENAARSFNFSGYSALDILTHQLDLANLYVLSMEPEIEIIHEQFYVNNSHSEVTSKINCYSKSRLHRIANLYCLKTFPTNLEGFLCAFRAQSSRPSNTN
ncbi:hypothetical protein GJ496_001290 [Pomphorhynchus laevis]|nr:hypothetical protein GJ496_001290 [Pomphorhynchus laevis]